MMVRNILIGIFLLAMTSAIWLGLQEIRSNPQLENKKGNVQEKEVNALQDKIKAPNFVLQRMDGGKTELIPKGKPAIINFWASWCGPCKVELPMLQRAYEQYKDDIQFQMVNLTIDDNEDKVKKLIHNGRYTFPVLFDVSGEVSEVYQILSIPTTYVVDKNGEIHKKVMGAMTEKQLTEILSSMQKID